MTSDRPAPNREHERRFLVEDLNILARHEGEGSDITQGYLFSIGGWKARARTVRYFDENANTVNEIPRFTLKGPRKGFTSAEYEFDLETQDAEDLLDIAPGTVVKTRYNLVSEGSPWEVDVFHGWNEGLVIAETEGPETSVSRVRKPQWARTEVTQHGEFNNENLAFHPISSWTESERATWGLR